MEPWIDADDGGLIVAVPVDDYRTHSDPDPAASYYAKRYGPGLTAAKTVLLRQGITIADVELWMSFDSTRVE